MRGIDISRWQKGIDLSQIDCDFVIVKATQGTSFISPTFKEQIEQAISLGRLVGIYHYAASGGFKAEADFFLGAVKDYIGRAILCLDWEDAENVNFRNPDYAMQWLKYVYQKTDITPFIYMSKSVCRTYDWSAVRSFPLWCAQYADHNPTGWQEEPWTDKKGFGTWGSPDIYQYTGSGRVPGYNGNLDLNKAYISASEWQKYAGASITPEPEPQPQPEKFQPHVKYKAYTKRFGWLPEVLDDTDYAGIQGEEILAFAVYATEGSVKYRCHTTRGKWYPYVTGYSAADFNNGFAGDKATPIDCIEIVYYTPEGKPYKRAKYQVSPVNKGYFAPQYDNEKTNGQDGYAGAYKMAIDRIMISLVD